MPDKMIYKLHADACKALGHAIRIEIIDLLGENELGFSEIANKTGVAQSSLSQHLTMMMEKGILTQRKEGLNTYFNLSSPKVAEACQLMREVLMERLEKTHELFKSLNQL